MKIYLAASYSRVDEANTYAQLLRDDGHVITSYWLTRIPEHQQWSRRRCAEQDVRDILKADGVLVLTGTPTTSGGHHVEAGIGLAAGKRIVIVGPRQNVFHHLALVEQYATFDEARNILKHGIEPEHVANTAVQDLMRGILEARLRFTADDDHGV